MKREDLESIDANKVLLVDIREADEVAVLPSLPNAIHVPMSKLVDELAQGTLPHDKTIVTICMTGNRCHTVNAFLEMNGFRTDLLEGGMSGLQK